MKNAGSRTLVALNLSWPFAIVQAWSYFLGLEVNLCRGLGSSLVLLRLQLL
jgi:hypothetical protein